MSVSSKCSERVRVGVIGCGPITLNAHADAISKAANIELEAIADRDEVLLTEMTHRLRPARAYRDGGDLLNDPRVELVVIAVHDRFHVPLARKALAAGKHVLVEKPLGLSVEECEGLRESLTNNRILAVGCNRRFLPEVRAFQHGIGGDVGQPSRFLAPERTGIPEEVLSIVHADFRGHGQSELGREGELSIATPARDLEALLDHLNIPQAVVGGISMGAAVALRFAIHRPDACAALILARPAWGDSPMSLQARQALALVATLGRRGFLGRRNA